MSNFDEAFAYLVNPHNEGTKFVDDPNDSGGPTKYGITLATLQRWHALHELPAANVDDVKNLSETTAKEIYEAFYWNEMGLDGVPVAAATAIFDFGVNAGTRTSVRLAQFALNIPVNGVMGQRTKAALAAATPLQFVSWFIAQVQDHYVGIVAARPEKIVFLKGWLTRSRRMLILIPAQEVTREVSNSANGSAGAVRVA